jgi:hypothetical protein
MGALVRNPPKPPREKQMYRETYKKGACKFDKGAMPLFVHLSDGCKPVECFLTAAGVVARGDERLEYQDIRVYFTV